ncbi:MAG: hypothetical protein AAF533_29585 [Acidobacteriota bacterium]
MADQLHRWGQGVANEGAADGPSDAERRALHARLDAVDAELAAPRPRRGWAGPALALAAVVVLGVALTAWQVLRSGPGVDDVRLQGVQLRGGPSVQVEQGAPLELSYELGRRSWVYVAQLDEERRLLPVPPGEPREQAAGTQVVTTRAAGAVGDHALVVLVSHEPTTMDGFRELLRIGNSLPESPALAGHHEQLRRTLEAEGALSVVITPFAIVPRP